MRCIGRTKKLARCKNQCKVLYCHVHRFQWWQVIVIIGVIAGLYQDFIKPIFVNIRDFKPDINVNDIHTNLDEIVFNPIFQEDDKENFNVLILRFEDYIADKNTYCIGRSIKENLVVSKANDSSLVNLRVRYISDSIPPPRNNLEALEIQERHNADLIIYGLAKNVKVDCEGADVCFRYKLTNTIIDKAKPAIDIKPEKFDLDYISTTPSKIELGEFSIDYISLNQWITSLSNLKRGNKKQAFFELDKIAMDSSRNKDERSKRFFEIGNTYYRMNENKKAIFAYEKAIELNPKNIEAFHNRAVSYWMENKLKRAKRDLEICIRNPYPGLQLSYYLKGLIYHEERSFKKAIVFFDMAINEDSTIARFYQSKGESLLRLNLPIRASGEFKKALTISDVDSAEAYNQLAETKRQQNLFYDALKYHNLAISKNPKNSEYYVLRGLTKTKTRNYNSALKDLDKAIEINPNGTDAYRFCASIYIEKGEYLNAKKESDKLIRMYPNFATGYMSKGRVYILLNNLEEAIKSFTQAIKINPDFSDVYYQRSKALLLNGDYESALKDCEKALSLNPDKVVYVIQKLTILFRMGNFKEFNKMFKDLSKSEKDGILS